MTISKNTICLSVCLRILYYDISIYQNDNFQTIIRLNITPSLNIFYQTENLIHQTIIRNKEIELHKRLNFESLAPELVCFIPRLKIEQNSEEMMELRKDLDSISKKKKELISVNSFDKRE